MFAPTHAQLFQGHRRHILYFLDRSSRFVWATTVDLARVEISPRNSRFCGRLKHLVPDRYQGETNPDPTCLRAVVFEARSCRSHGTENANHATANLERSHKALYVWIFENTGLILVA